MKLDRDRILQALLEGVLFAAGVLGVALAVGIGIGLVVGK